MSAVEKNVDRRNSTVTVVDGTYCVDVPCSYVTGFASRSQGRLMLSAHMTEAEARALLAGLQEALG